MKVNGRATQGASHKGYMAVQARQEFRPFFGEQLPAAMDSRPSVRSRRKGSPSLPSTCRTTSPDCRGITLGARPSLIRPNLGR